MFDIKRSFGGRESTAKGLLVSIAATIAVSLSGCGGPEAPPPAPVLTEHIVDPSSTGALIDPSFGSHYAYPSDATSKGKLFVFFAASLSNPSQYQLIEKAAASSGYHSLGLAYPNADVVGLLCAGTSDTACEGKIRAETLTGANTSTLVAVNVPNSVENRLAKALVYLNTTYPTEGWGTYVPGGVVQWNLIRLAGHSQGGGLAAYAATQRWADRVCAFSSPADWNDAVNAGLGGPAPWLSATSATPSGSYYGFGH